MPSPQRCCYDCCCCYCSVGNTSCCFVHVCSPRKNTTTEKTRGTWSWWRAGGPSPRWKSARENADRTGATTTTTQHQQPIPPGGDRRRRQPSGRQGGGRGFRGVPRRRGSGTRIGEFGDASSNQVLSAMLEGAAGEGWTRRFCDLFLAAAMVAFAEERATRRMGRACTTHGGTVEGFARKAGIIPCSLRFFSLSWQHVMCRRACVGLWWLFLSLFLKRD